MKNSFPGGRANRETRGVKNSVQITEKALLQLRAKRSFSGGSPPREWTLKWNPETKHLAGQLLKCCSVNAHNNLKRQFSQVVPYPWDTVRPVCVYRSDCVTQSCLTLCDPMDCSPPGSSVHGILPARILQWVAIPFSRRSSWPRIEPESPILQADSLLSEPPGKLSYFLLSTFVCFICLFWKRYVKISQLWLRIVNFFFVIPSIFSINILRTC